MDLAMRGSVHWDNLRGGASIGNHGFSNKNRGALQMFDSSHLKIGALATQKSVMLMHVQGLTAV